MENNVNKSNKLTSILLIIIAALLGLVAYLVYDKIQTSPKATTEPKQEIKVELKTIDTEAIKKDIILKTNNLLKNYKEEGTSYNLNGYLFPTYLFKNLSLTFDEKREIALSLAKTEKVNIPKDKISVQVVKDDYDILMEDYKTNEYAADYLQKSAKEVEKLYYDLYSEKITHKDAGTSEDHTFCGFYYYDEANEVYYLNRNCGGFSNDQYVIYMDNFTINDTEATLDLYLGYIKDMESNCTNGVCVGETTYKLYSDINESKVIKDITSQTDCSNYKITETTKDQFSKYKFTFKKNSEGNYYFSKIEKN